MKVASSINKHYSDEDWAAVKRVKDWLAGGRGRSQAALAKMSGVAAGTLNQVIAGKYKAPPGTHTKKLLDVLDREHDRAAVGAGLPFIPTSVGRAVLGACRRAHQDRDFGLFAGRVGIGKSIAARHYAETTPSAILLESWPGAGVMVILRRMAAACGATMRTEAGRRGTRDDLHAAIIDTLRAGDRCIIIDEAETLARDALAHLRRISDAAGVGVVLIGTPALMHLVWDPDGPFGQISSRIGFWPPVIERISDEDVLVLSRAFFGGERPDDDVLAALGEASEGSARALRNILRNTWRACQKAGQPMSADAVRQIDQQTMAARRGRRAA